MFKGKSNTKGKGKRVMMIMATDPNGDGHGAVGNGDKHDDCNGVDHDGEGDDYK